MQTALLNLAVWMLAVVACAANAQTETGPTDGLSQDPNSPVIVYDTIGGMLARVNDEPVLSIYANGHVVLGNPWGVGRRIEAHIDSARLDELLQMIVEKYQFFNIDTDKLTKQLREEQGKTIQQFSVVDASTSIVRVNTGNRQHEVKLYALGYKAERYPGIDALQRLYVIEQELGKVMTWIQIGGEEGIRAELGLVNEWLLDQHPDIMPLASGDLKFATIHADGSRTVQFARHAAKKQGNAGDDVSVYVKHPHQGNPEFTISR